MLIDTEAAFEMVEEMLYGIAWKFTKRYRLPFEEAKREVFWGYMIAAPKYQPDRGMKFSTWITWKVTKHMQGWIKDRFSDRLCFVEEVREDSLVTEVREDAKEILDHAKDLSADAREMLRLLIDLPEGLTPHNMIKHLKRALCFERGADRVDAAIALHELRCRFERVTFA